MPRTNPTATPRPLDYFIERVPAKEFVKHLDRWKQLKAEGYQVDVLLDLSDRKTVVALGLRN